MRYALTLFTLLVACSAAAQPISPQEIWVADGDTIAAHGKTYRLVGFDTPETGDKAKCAKERALGERAAALLREIVNQGGLDLTEVRCACDPGKEGTRWCNWGRSCGTLTAKGVNVGKILIGEALARPFHCGKYRCPKRQPWC